MADNNDQEQNYYELNNEEIEKAIFNKENVENFMLYQKCLELVGIVGEVEMKNSVMKFTLVNRSGITIQATIWDESVKEKMNDFLVTGNIIHLDGIFVSSKHPTLSNSNIDYDISVCTNSTVHMIKAAPKYSSICDQNKITVSSIADSVQYSSPIMIEAWIKQKISQESLPNNCKINQGCLSDCQKYKLEIRMPVDQDMSTFTVGSHVKVTGTIKYSSASIYLWVLKKEDVVLVSNETKRLGELLRGVASPKRILEDVSNKSAKKVCSKLF